MTISVRMTSAIVTKTLTYRGYYFVMDEYQDGNIATVEAPTGEVLLTLTDAAYESRDGTVYRVTGRDAEGNDVVWRCVKICKKCSTMRISDTPSFDLPS